MSSLSSGKGVGEMPDDAADAGLRQRGMAVQEVSPRQPSLYIHIPFCLSRCGYCAFTSGIYDFERADAYLAALQDELKARAVFPHTPPQTLFIGGGTPSCLDVKQLEKLLAMLPIFGAEEATCELNPDSATPEKLSLLRDYGITRCSFGIQTFSEQGLRYLQRRHDAAIAIRAVERAIRIGFTSVNIDLINGWPGHDEKQLRRDLEIICNLGIQHISNYTLIIEEEAPLAEAFRGSLADGDAQEERDRRYWEYIEEYLGVYGFEHYETSNFSLPGHCCIHNVLTWKGGEYIGLGVAAHSHLAGRRFANTDDIGDYLANASFPERIETYSERLEPEEKAMECAVFWLRLFVGVDLREFRARTGFDFAELYADELPHLLAEGMVEYAETGEYIRVPRSHQPILDAIVSHLV